MLHHWCKHKQLVLRIKACNSLYAVCYSVTSIHWEYKEAQNSLFRQTSKGCLHKLHVIFCLRDPGNKNWISKWYQIFGPNPNYCWTGAPGAFHGLMPLLKYFVIKISTLGIMSSFTALAMSWQNIKIHICNNYRNTYWWCLTVKILCSKKCYTICHVRSRAYLANF